MAGEAHVFLVQHDYEADHKVFFVDNDYEEQNTALITPGALVQHDYEANIKVYVVAHDFEATIKITRQHFPK